MAIDMIVKMIIVIVAFMLIAMTVKRCYSGADEKEAGQLCYNSIGLRAAASTSGGSVQLVPVLCKTIDHDVEGDREEIKQQLANDMARCWWMFHEGRYEGIINDEHFDFSNMLGFERNSNGCFICYSNIIQEEEIPDSNHISKREMERYLIENEYQLKGVKYIDYFQTYGGPGAVSIHTDIEPRSAYAIVFLAKNRVRDNPVAQIQQTVLALGTELGIYDDNSERYVSVILLDTLDNAQQHECIEDIAGR